MNRFVAGRARARAIAQLSYREWAVSPSTAPIPALAVLSDPRIHERERERTLRRAQNGVFDAPAQHLEPAFLAR